VRLIEPLDTENNQVGDSFHATLNAALSSDGEEAVPAGVEVTGHIVEVKSASKFAGKSLLVLQLDVLASAGKNYRPRTDQYRKEGKERGKNTAEKVGGELCWAASLAQSRVAARAPPSVLLPEPVPAAQPRRLRRATLSSSLPKQS
jgi:hypothetical protein